MKKFLPIAGATLALALALTGCSAGADTDDAVAPKKTSSATPTPTPTAEPTDEAKDTQAPATSAAGVVVTFEGQGEKGADGEYAKYPVEIAVTVPSITPLSAAELESIVTIADDDQKNTFAAFDFYKVIVNETYVSGNDPKFQATYTSYKAIDAKGAELNNLPLIGFDWCASSSFEKDFVTGTPNESCLIGAVAKGGEAPAGVQFSQYGTDTDAYDGTPIVIFK